MNKPPLSFERRGLSATLRFFPVMLMLLAGATSQSAGQAGIQLVPATPKLAVEKITLANGLQLILHVDSRLPLVTVNFWVHAGTKNEQPGHDGLAHLFEHLMFQGSKNAPGNYNSYIRKAGGDEWVDSGAARTTWDYTQYSSTVPSSSLEFLLWLDSDRLATLSEALTQERLDNQREVVKNERRQYQNTPYYSFYQMLPELLAGNLFDYGHPYSHKSFGNDSDLATATLDDMRSFFRSYYSPNNISLAIVGDFDPQVAQRLVEKYFGPIPRGPAMIRPPRWIPRLNGERIIEVRDYAPQLRTCLVWISPPYFEPGDAELDLAAAILSDGLSSRLNRSLVREKRICASVSAGQFSSEDSGVFYVWTTAMPGVDLSRIELEVSNEITQLAQQGPTVPELNRAKQRWEYEFVSRIEKIGGWGGKADRLNQYNTFFGIPDKLGKDIARYRNATAESVRKTVGAWLDTPTRALFRFYSDGPGTGSPQVTLDRSQIPSILKDRPFETPDVKSTKLSNGLEVLVVEAPELPKVTVKLVLRAGSAWDPPGKEGLADLTVEAVRKGPSGQGSGEVDDALAGWGAVLGGWADKETAALDLGVLKSNLAPAFTLFSAMVQHPAFAEEELGQIKQGRLAWLSGQMRNPELLAWRLAPALAFGAAHPYGHPPSGSPASVQTLSREDLVRFHAARWRPEETALIFVGDITFKEAVGLAQRGFAAWASAGAPTAKALEIPEPQPVTARTIYLVDQPNATQTVAVLIMAAPYRESDDYGPVRLINAVWGGGSAGRLNMNLRQAKGYSYGVYSFLTSYRFAGLWTASGSIQTDKTREAIVEMIRELDDIGGARPISEKELAEVRSNLTRAYAQQFQTASQVAEQVSQAWALGLRMSYFGEETAQLERVSLASVNQLARKYVGPGSAALLLVGDEARIRAAALASGWGKIVELDREGRPLGSRPKGD